MKSDKKGTRGTESTRTIDSAIDPTSAVIAWLQTFEGAVTQGDADAAAGLFAEDGHWRDLVVFTWHIRTGRYPRCDARSA
jgi:putative flavoprotein involved in K+ transport